MNEPTIHLRTPEDLLALVPCVLGFHPERSLVMVAPGRDGEALHARVDLPDDEIGLAAAVSGLMTGVLRANARKVAVVAYTADPLLAEAACDLLDEKLLHFGAELVTAIRADGDRWYALDCQDDCCPAEGTPYNLTVHPFTARSVLEGRVTYRSRRELADSLIGTDTDRIEAVGQAVEESARRLRAQCRDSLGHPDPAGERLHLVAEGSWVRERVQRFVATMEPLDAAEMGRLLVAIENIEVRDVAWAEMRRPHARLHVELWREVVRHSPPELLAAPAALLGFASWLGGDGALAWCAVERCQQAQPDYGLAELLSQALLEAIHPSSWTPVPFSDLSLFAG